jgi:hypothetical protein
MDGGQLSAIRGARLFDGERLTDGPVLVLVDHGRRGCQDKCVTLFIPAPAPQTE